MDISSKISKVKNYRKISDSEYQLQAAWTSSDMVEMNNGNSLEKELENLNTDIDNKLSALETNIDWKETVETYDDIATIYPNPEDGWTVNTKDNNITYRYNGSEWVAISANAIPKATNEVDGLMTKEYAKKLDGLTKYTPDGTTITADEDGTLHGADTIQVDGITITRDDATKVIALAKTLQDKIALVDNKIDKANVANNLTTTEANFVLDARQGKALQDQLTTLNGSLNTVFYSIKETIDANNADPGLSHMPPNSNQDTSLHNPFPVFHTILLTIPFNNVTTGYAVQIGVSISGQYNGKLAVRTKDAGTWGNWNIIS